MERNMVYMEADFAPSKAFCCQMVSDLLENCISS